MARAVATRQATAEEGFRNTATAVNGILDGRTNCVGSVTLAENVTTTVVTDVRVGVDSVITMMPMTANAAAEAWYIATRDKGTFTITHANAASTDRDFRYSLSGTGRGT